MRMWDKIMKCFNAGGKGKGCSPVQLPELFKRVPPNQRKQLQIFAKKHEEYKERVRKHPSKMPTIDWQYYKNNVRKEYVDWVNEFQLHYDNLDSIFANRHTLIDHSKYFGPLSKETEEVKKQVQEYKLESDKRIARLQKKMDDLKSMKPYVEMTMEEFCYAHPNEAPDFINKPTFWPHTPEEQTPGPMEVHAPEPEPEDTSGGKTPKGAAPKPSPKPATPTDTLKPKGDAAKDTKETKPSDAKPKSAEECEKSAAVDANAGSEKAVASQTTATSPSLATQGVEFAKDLAAKSIILLKSLWMKITEKANQVSESAKAERLKTENEQKQAAEIAAKPKADATADDIEDSFYRRDGASNICHKTIIRGEDTAKADVKPHHENLEIEGEAKKDVCKLEKEEDECKVEEKYEEPEEELKCEEEKEKVCPKERENSVSCAEQDKVAEEDYCISFMSKKCDPEEDNFDPCKKKEKDDESKCSLDTDYGSTKKQEPKNIEKCENVYVSTEYKTIHKGDFEQKSTTFGPTQKPPSMGSSEAPQSAKWGTQLPKGQNANDMLQPTSKVQTQDSAVNTPKVIGSENLQSTSKDFMQKGSLPQQKVGSAQGQKEITLTDNPEFADQLKGEKISPNEALQTAELALAEKFGKDTKNKDKDQPKKPVAKPEPKPEKVDNINYGEVAKNVFHMATDAASLLTEAKNAIEKAQLECGDNVKALEAAYISAEKQVTLALDQAYKALSSANMLTNQAKRSFEAEDQEAAALVEKHAILAKLLSYRAITMKKELAKLLTGLKNKI